MEENNGIIIQGMKLVYKDVVNNFQYYRDYITDVMYVRYACTSGYAGMGGLTVMMDPTSGLPLTYTRYLQLASRYQ